MKRLILILLLIAFIFNLSLPLFPQNSDLDKMLNYNSKTRALKIIKDSIAEDKKASKKIDFKKIKDRLLTKPLMAHFLIEQGFNIIGTVAQFGLVGLPGGTMAGAIINSVTGNFGGALGYEVSVSLEKKEKKSVRDYVGDAMVNIDAPLFINQTALGVAGAIVGSMILTPFPGIGAAVGGLIGKLIGTFFTTKTRNTKIGKKVYSKIQKQWNKGAYLIKGKKKQPSGKPTVVISNDNKANHAQKLRALKNQLNQALLQQDFKRVEELKQKIKQLQAP